MTAAITFTYACFFFCLLFFYYLCLFVYIPGEGNGIVGDLLNVANGVEALLVIGCQGKTSGDVKQIYFSYHNNLSRLTLDRGAHTQSLSQNKCVTSIAPMIK